MVPRNQRSYDRARVTNMYTCESPCPRVPHFPQTLFHSCIYLVDPASMASSTSRHHLFPPHTLSKTTVSAQNPDETPPLTDDDGAFEAHPPALIFVHGEGKSELCRDHRVGALGGERGGRCLGRDLGRYWESGELGPETVDGPAHEGTVPDSEGGTQETCEGSAVGQDDIHRQSQVLQAHRHPQPVLYLEVTRATP